jgi:hypothetical protein
LEEGGVDGTSGLSEPCFGDLIVVEGLVEVRIGSDKRSREVVHFGRKGFGEVEEFGHGERLFGWPFWEGVIWVVDYGLMKSAW